MINDYVRVSTSAKLQAAVILPPILVIVHRTSPIFNLRQEFDKSNLYNMKFGRKRVINE